MPSPNVSGERIMGHSLEELSGMTEAQREQVIRDYFQSEGLDDIEDAREQLDEQFNRAGERLDEYRDDLRSVSRGRRRGRDVNETAQERAEELLGEIEELEELIDTLQDEAGEVQGNLAELNIDRTNGDNVTISPLDLDDHNGDTFTYNMGGGAAGGGAGIFGGPSAQSDEEYLREERITNAQGEVIRDFNSDGVMNYEDRTAALQARAGMPEERQNVFINTAGQHWTLVSADQGAGTVTFKVEGADGEYAYVTFTNASNVRFSFNSGLNPADVSIIGTNWPEWLQRISYDGSSQTSFYDELHEDETTPQERYRSIRGYNGVRNGASAAAQFTDIPAGLPANLQSAYQSAVDRIFEYIDSGDTRPVSEIWSEIIQGWSGLSARERSQLVQFLTITFFLNGRTQFGGTTGADGTTPSTGGTIFSTFFGQGIAQLESILLQGRTNASTDAGITNGEKIAILILESQTGAAGEFGGAAAVLSTLFAHPGTATPGTTTPPATLVNGTWVNHCQNATILNLLRTLLSQGGASIATLQQTITNETSFTMTSEEAQREGGRVALTTEQFDDIDANLGRYAMDFMIYYEDSAYADDDWENEPGVNAAELVTDWTELFEELRDGNYTARDMAQHIIEIARNYENERARNNFAAGIIYILEQHAPQLLDAMMVAFPSFAPVMWDIISNGVGREPGGERHYGLVARKLGFESTVGHD